MINRVANKKVKKASATSDRKTKKPAYDLVGVGMCASDYISLVERNPGSNDKADSIAFSNQGGSPVPTALCVAAKWGATAAFIGNIGGDEDGRYITRELQSFGVDTKHLIIHRELQTPKAFITVEKTTGNRAIVFNRLGMPFIRPRDVTPLPTCRIFHTDGRDVAACLAAMRAARKNGAAVMMDAGNVRPRMDEFIAATDYFIASHSFIRAMFGGARLDVACKQLVSRGPRLAMVTLGSRGCLGATSEGVFKVPAFHRDNFILDTTGAGDVFHGAFLYGLLQGWDYIRCSRVAAAAALLKCRELGGRKGIPTLAAALKLARTAK